MAVLDPRCSTFARPATASYAVRTQSAQRRDIFHLLLGKEESPGSRLQTCVAMLMKLIQSTWLAQVLFLLSSSLPLLIIMCFFQSSINIWELLDPICAASHLWLRAACWDGTCKLHLSLLCLNTRRSNKTVLLRIIFFPIFIWVPVSASGAPHTYECLKIKEKHSPKFWSTYYSKNKYHL